MQWNCYIKHTNLKISKGIGILTKLRRLSKGVLRTLFYAFVQPRIDYGLVVWGSATPSNQKPLSKAFTKSSKENLKNKNRIQPTEPLFYELKVLDFDKHNKFLTMSGFMWQLTYDNIPDKIKSSFKIRNGNYRENSNTISNTIFLSSDTTFGN